MGTCGLGFKNEPLNKLLLIQHGGRVKDVLEYLEQKKQFKEKTGEEKTL